MARKFLIVDDSKVVRISLSRLLGRLKVRETDIAFAESGEESLKVFQDFEPDVVFMDIMMPGLDGEAAAGEMFEVNPEVKIVVVTGAAPDDERVRNLVAAGAFAVLEKPVRSTDVKALLAIMDEEEPGVGRIR